MIKTVLFNKGYLCKNCGPIQEVTSKNKQGLKRIVCKACEGICDPWIKPLKERAGRCSNCAHGAFKQAIMKGQFITCCKKCEQVVNIDTNKIIRGGKSDY